MISREEAEAYWKGQLKTYNKGDNHTNLELGPRVNTWHYGKCELYDLMDYIYGKPQGTPPEVLEAAWNVIGVERT